MKLPSLAINNYQFLLVLVVMALGLGILSYRTMPRSEDPMMNSPFFSVIAVYPGASPKDMEELIINPIEEELNEVEDLNKVNTSAEEGIAIIRVESEFGIDTDDKYDEIVRAVNNVKGDLPADILSLETHKYSPLDVIIHQYALVSEEAAYKDLNYWAEKLEDQISRIKAVRTVDIHANPQEEVRIAIELEKLALMNIPLNQVRQILEANNLNIPGGNLEVGHHNFTIQTSGSYESLEELKNTVIAGHDGQIVHLRDVADVYLDYEDPRYLGRYNGEKAVFISVTQKAGKNVLNIDREVQSVVENFKAELPQNITVETAFRQAPAVSGRVNDFFMNLLQGVFLVGLIILLFLGFRTSLIVMTVIPTAILIAIFSLDMVGFGLQQISIAGLVIALGLLVDNAIVVVENINRFLREGHSLVDAAVKGTSEVGWALVSSTATTVLAFFPMSQLGGSTGEYLKSMPLIVIFALLASLILALTLTPLMSSKLMKKTGTSPTLLQGEVNRIITYLYRPSLQFALRRPWAIIGLSVLLLAGSGWLFQEVGVSFFPTADKPMIVVDIETPDGTNIYRTNQVVRDVEQVLAEKEIVTSYVSNVGHGNPQIYYNIIPKSYRKNIAQILVNLESWEEERFYSLIDELRTRFNNYPGAQISLVELKNGPPYAAPIEIKVIGDDLEKLKQIAGRVESLIENTEGTINVSNPLSENKTDLKVAVNRERAAMLGVQLAEVDMAVRTAISGSKVGAMNTPDGEEYDMVVRLPKDERMQVEDFQKIQVSSVVNTIVPLRQFAELKFQQSATKVDHFNLQRTATVTADLLDDYNTAEVTEEIIQQLNLIQLPSGYSFYIGGEYETQQESFGNLGQLLIIAVLGILAILILQFRSFSQPLIVLSAIPLAFTGSIGMLYLMGLSFSFFAFVGFTSLIGIVVNTSIILVDYTNQLRADGMDMMEALQKAAETRFTPILLTAMTTIIGLLPLTITGSDLWAPLGWTIIGGMISSTLLTVLVVPVLYGFFGKSTGRV